MKKRICLVLALCLAVFVLFGGCTAGEEQGTSETGAAAATSAAAAATSDVEVSAETTPAAATQAASSGDSTVIGGSKIASEVSGTAGATGFNEKQNYVVDSTNQSAGFKPKEIKTDPKDVTIAFSIYTMAGSGFVAMENAVAYYAQQLGCTYMSYNADDSIEKQIADVEDIIAQNVDILIVNPKDTEAMLNVVDKASKAGIVVVNMDNLMDASANVVAFVTSDNFTIGKLVGEWTAQQFTGKQAIVGYLSGYQGSIASEDRRTGFTVGFTEQTLKMNSACDLNIVAQGWGSWNTPDGQTAFEDMITAHPDMNLLVAENDSMALGAYNVIKEMGIQDQIMVVACADGQKEALELIQQGEYGATGLNSVYCAGYTAVDVGLKVLAGGSVQKTVLTPAVAITKDNVDDWYDPNSVF